ncbi:MAG: LysR family transcriptional regulator [Eggerthellales bacterium]|nr:LysR family transcriptional regulator [Eggerthellales bacterium]
MTLQQLRYLMAVAQQGSFNAAATQLFVSQSTLSISVKELEEELGIQIFLRSNRGLKLTNEGTELLGYARQVLEQAELLENRYATRAENRARLAISTQHYAFCVQAFVALTNEVGASAYDFTLRETRTGEIIDDVRNFKADIGILYLSESNEKVLTSTFTEAHLTFTPLFEARTHVFVGAHHPLASRPSVSLTDLEEYPRYSFEQGLTNSFHYSEEPFGFMPHSRNITYSDRATLTSLLSMGNGYTLSTGVLSDEMASNIVALPLKEKSIMRVGYITHDEKVLSELAKRYLEKLHEIIESNPSDSIIEIK